jgi:hypothetical protein
MAKKQREDKIEKLLKVAQVMNLMQGGQQQAKGQNIQAMLGMLGLMQSDENADADRAFREKSFGTEVGLKREDSAAANDRFAKEFGFREKEAGKADTRFDSEQQYRDERASVSDFLTQAGLTQQKELAEKQIGSHEKGRRMDIVSDAMKLPNADMGSLMKALSALDPEFGGWTNDFGAEQEKKKQEAVNSILNATKQAEAKKSEGWLTGKGKYQDAWTNPMFQF